MMRIKIVFFNMEDSKKTIKKSVAKFFYGTLLSRFSGLLRDILMASFFGSSSDIAAFMVSFRFANLFRRLFGEGSLQASFIPHFERLRVEDRKKASRFYRDLFFSLFILLLVFVLFSEAGLALTHFFSLENDAMQIINLTMIMLPGLIFICLYALSSSVLQCHRKFFLPAVAPIAFNLTWILFVFLLRNKIPSYAVIVLSVAIVLGFFMQWVLVAFQSFRFGSEDLTLKGWLRPKLFSKELKKLIPPIILSVIGIGAVQINSAMDSIFAKIADDAAPAYLWYAIRIEQLPLALFGIAISSALLPPLSRAIKTNMHHKINKFFNLALSRSMGLMVSVTMAIFVLGGVSINLLYGRGEFDQVSIINTLKCLWAYGFGLFPATYVLIFSTFFYAKKNYFYPMLGALLSVVLNIILNSIFVFVFHLNAPSIAFATSLSAGFNCLFLYFVLKKEKDLFDKHLWGYFIRALLCSLISALLVILVGVYLLQDPGQILLLFQKEYLFSRIFTYQIRDFAFLTGIFFVSLFTLSYIFKADEILDNFKNLIKK